MQFEQVVPPENVKLLLWWSLKRARNQKCKQGHVSDMRKFIEQPIIVTGENKAKVDLVLIQSFLLYYVFDVVFYVNYNIF